MSGAELKNDKLHTTSPRIWWNILDYYHGPVLSVWTLADEWLTLKSAKLNKSYFHSLEVVYRYRNPQLQMSENYSYLFTFT